MIERENKLVDDEKHKNKKHYTFAELRDYMTELEQRETRVVHVRKERRVSK